MQKKSFYSIAGDKILTQQNLLARDKTKTLHKTQFSKIKARIKLSRNSVDQGRGGLEGTVRPSQLRAGSPPKKKIAKEKISPRERSVAICLQWDCFHHATLETSLARGRLTFKFCNKKVSFANDKNLKQELRACSFASCKTCTNDKNLTQESRAGSLASDNKIE